MDVLLLQHVMSRSLSLIGRNSVNALREKEFELFLNQVGSAQTSHLFYRELEPTRAHSPTSITLNWASQTHVNCLMSRFHSRISLNPADELIVGVNM